MMIFTSDIDWAPEEVIADTLALFEKYNVKCTFFATHKSKEILQSNKELFEVGLHPDFNPILSGNKVRNDNIDKVLQNLISIYPEAKGVRSHSMTQSTKILAKFIEYNLLYDANIFLPYHSNIKIFKSWNGLIRIPFNWEDDIHWGYGYTFETLGLDFKDDLLILNFHPIHIFLNTDSQKRYDEAKKYYRKPKKLIEYRNTTNAPGVRDLLICLLKYMKTNKMKTRTLLDIAAFEK